MGHLSRTHLSLTSCITHDTISSMEVNAWRIRRNTETPLWLFGSLGP